MKPKLGAAAKTSYGRGFGVVASDYDRVRPGYPQAVIDWLLAEVSPGGPIVDVGAGTGILSQVLVKRGFAVTAVDPDDQALAHNPAATVVGQAEHLPLPAHSAHAVVSAQAWHWFDEARAVAEIARVLAPGGWLGIVINQLDVRIDWVLRLSRIMHAGDVYRPEYRPTLGERFGPVETRVEEFRMPMTVDDIVDLAKTRSYWLRSSPQTRAKVEANIRWYFSHEYPVTGGLDLPYLCLAYRAQLQ